VSYGLLGFRGELGDGPGACSCIQFGLAASLVGSGSVPPVNSCTSVSLPGADVVGSGERKAALEAITP
jgi:hypothetical protein